MYNNGEVVDNMASRRQPGRSYPLTDYQQTQMRISEVTDDTLDSTRRILSLCEESKDAGARTLVELDAQGEQLNKMEKHMDRINNDIQETEKALKGMEQCCGICMCFGGKNPAANSSASSDGAWSAVGNGMDGGGQVVIGTQPKPLTNGQQSADNWLNNGASNAGGARFINQITSDAREDEMEENMQQVHSVLGTLKSMAIDMGSSITTQNSQLDRINVKAESNKVRIHGANERTQRLLNK